MYILSTICRKGVLYHFLLFSIEAEEEYQLINHVQAN